MHRALLPFIASFFFAAVSGLVAGCGPPEHDIQEAPPEVKKRSVEAIQKGQQEAMEKMMRGKGKKRPGK